MNEFVETFFRFNDSQIVGLTGGGVVLLLMILVFLAAVTFGGQNGYDYSEALFVAAVIAIIIGIAGAVFIMAPVLTGALVGIIALGVVAYKIGRWLGSEALFVAAVIAIIIGIAGAVFIMAPVLTGALVGIAVLSAIAHKAGKRLAKRDD